MKINKLTILLIIIIVILLGYIAYDKLYIPSKNKKVIQEDYVEVLDTINLEYASIYLTSDGLSYISPISSEEIEKLKVNNNLKDRLNNLYIRALYYDIFINNYKLKGYRVKLDDKINKIVKIVTDTNTYVIFLKDNNTIGVFDYLEYYDLLNTKVEDNYQNIKDVKDIKNNKIIYLDGSSETINWGM